jgi:hypothetical protein
LVNLGGDLENGNPLVFLDTNHKDLLKIEFMEFFVERIEEYFDINEFREELLDSNSEVSPFYFAIKNEMQLIEKFFKNFFRASPFECNIQTEFIDFVQDMLKARESADIAKVLRIICKHFAFIDDLVTIEEYLVKYRSERLETNTSLVQRLKISTVT